MLSDFQPTQVETTWKIQENAENWNSFLMFNSIWAKLNLVHGGEIQPSRGEIEASNEPPK